MCIRDRKRYLDTTVAVFLLLGLLLLSGLACSQAGEILTPAEATAQAEAAKATPRPLSTPKTAEEEAISTDLSIGEAVVYVGESYLIPMFTDPGSRNAFSYAGRGEAATVLDLHEVDGVLWYEVKGGAGQGWVEGKYLQAAAGEPDAETEPAAPAGPQIGDTVLLTGKSYLITLVEAPGATKMKAVQERGVEVTILNLEDLEGETWYYVDAPTGEGWVKAENISVEEP